MCQWQEEQSLERRTKIGQRSTPNLYRGGEFLLHSPLRTPVIHRRGAALLNKLSRGIEGCEVAVALKN